MSNTGNRFLFGTEFTNITVVANCDNTEDGSIEASGTLFVNTIKEYDISSPGVTLEDSIFASGKAIITSTETSLNISTAALIVYGGISILKDARYYGAFYLHNTVNSYGVNSGSLVVDGGASIFKNLSVGGILNLYDSTSSINSSVGSLISIGGISIRDTTDALSITSGGALTVAGGASIEKTLFANLLNINNATIGNSYLINITNNNLYSSNAHLQNLTSGNIIANNITTSSLITNYIEGTSSSISNLNLTYGTFGNVLISTQNVTNSTIDNLYTNTAYLHTISITQGNIENLTVGTLHVNTNIEYNDIVTNLSTSNILSQYVTIANLLFTYGTYANLYGTDLYTTNLTVPNLLSTYLSTANLSTYNVTSINSSSANSFITNSTIANILSTNINTSNATIANLYNTNLTSTNIQTTNVTSTNILGVNSSFIYTTTGYLNLTGTLPSFNSSTGTFISYGGISIDIIENATSITSGGGLTVAGGASIAKDLYIGYTLYVPNISSSNISSIYGTVSHLLGTDLNYVNSTFNNIYLTSTTPSSNSSSGAFISFGGVSIDCSKDVTSITNGGGLTISGGASIAKSLLVGETLGSSTITTGTIYAIGSTITNILNTNITSNNGLITNINNTNLTSSNVLTTNIISSNSTITNGLITNISTSTLHSSDIYYTNLNGTSIYTHSLDANYISNNISLTSLTGSVSNLISTKSTIQNLQLTNGTFSNLIGSYIDVNNASISSLLSTNIFTTNETTTNLLASNITTKTLVGTTSNFLYGTISNALGINSSFTNSTVVNFNVSNITSSSIIANSITTSTLNASSGQFITQTSNFNTFGSVYITSTECSLNSTTASIVVSGGISIQCTENATSHTSGGSSTIEGGLAVNKDVYIGGSTWISGNLDMNSHIVTNVTSPTNSLDVANKYYVDNRFDQYTIGNVSGNFTQGQVIIATTGGNITGYSEFMYDINQGALYIYSTNDATSVSQGGSLQVSGGASVDKNFYVGGNAHVLGTLDMNNQKITSVAIPTTYYDAANKYYVDNRFNEFTIGNVSGNFTQGQVIVASTQGNITGFDTFTFFNNTLSVFTTDEATSLTSGGVLSISGGARIAKSLYIGGPVLQIPTGNTLTRPVDAIPGTVRYNSETQQFEGFGAGNNWGSLGGVVDIAQTTKILASASPSTTDGNLYFYTVGDERMRINSSGNVGIGTSAPTSKLSVNGDLLVTGGIDAGGQLITNATAPTLGLDVVNKWYLDQRFEQYTIGNVSGNFTQGQVIVASIQGNITGFDSFTFLNNSLNILTTDEATSLTSGGVLSISGGARIAKSLYIGGPVLQIPTGDTLARPVNSIPGTVRYNTETQQFEGFGAGNNWGSLGGVVDIAQTTKILASASPSTTDGNLYFYTVGDERMRINSSGNVGIGTSAPTAKLSVSGDLLVTGGIDAGGQLITNATAPTLGLDVVNKWYLDQRFEQYTIGNVSGNFTQGQVIVASTEGNITGFDSFTFFDNSLNIFTTDDTTSLTSGGVLAVSGGARIAKSLFIGGGIDAGGQLITNATAPTLGLDVVNKWYLDQRFEQYTIGNVSGNFTQGQVIVASTEGNITGFDSFTFFDNSLNVFTTSEATSLTSGGVLAVSGGARIAKSLYIGGGVNAGGQLITNVTAPTIGLDVVNKWYLDQRFEQYTIGNVSGNFTQGQVIVASTQGNITGFDSFTFFDNSLNVLTTSEATSLTSGGVLNVSGGARIAKSLYIGGPVLQIPTGDTLARPINAIPGTVRYNSETQQFEGFGAGNNWGSLGGVVDIAQTTKILASASPSTTDGNLYFYTVGDERMRINSSGNVGIGTSAPTAKLSVSGDLLVTGGIDAGGQLITNVTAPTLGLDAVNKWYLDYRLNQYTIGNVNGNFTQGQVIIASTEGNITGFNSFMFDGTKLAIYTTDNATNLTSGGVFGIAGGATIAKDVYIGGKLDVNLNNITNVQDPYQDYDAVNKKYVDDTLENIFGVSTGYFEYNYELENNVNIPTNLPEIIIPYTSKAFIANVYINTPDTSSIYTLKGFKGNIWGMTSKFIGGNVSDVGFYINDDGVNLNIQYTNNASQGLTTISYRIANLVDTTASPTQSNISLNASVMTPTDVSGLSFNNPITNSVKLLIYISSDTDSKYSLFDLNALKKNGTWILNTSFTGNIDTIVFNITSTGQIQYTNSSSASDYLIRVKQYVLDDVPIEYTLNSNTITPSNIEKLDILLNDYINTYFLALAYVYLPAQNQYALYEIEGVSISNIWHINTRFIGDNTGITFSLTSTSAGYYLSYTNHNNVNGYLRLINLSESFTLNALPVSKGGTGTTYLNEYTILRGNGLNKILGTNDLIYKDNKLTLGPVSSIILNSTQDAINLTSGTLVSYGGISIAKTVRIGEELVVNNVNMTPLSDDILSEKTFEANNNQTIAQNVDGFIFSSNSKSFNSTMCVTVTTTTTSLDSLYEIKGLRKSTGWTLYMSYVGDNVGITFNITSLGQVQYISSDKINWISTTMKFKALTTSM